MSSDQPYTPSDEQVRFAYADRRLFEDYIGGCEPSPDAVYNAEFDRFLARVRRNAQAEALREAAIGIEKSDCSLPGMTVSDAVRSLRFRADELEGGDTR